MRCPGRAEYQNIIKEDQDKLLGEGFQDITREGLKCGRCVGEAKGHD